LYRSATAKIRSIPDASVVPTPFKLVSVAAACSTLGSFLNAFLLSVCTALGVLMRTKLVNCGKNLPRCGRVTEREGEKGKEKSVTLEARVANLVLISEKKD